jgi:hypothetical protein
MCGRNPHAPIILGMIGINAENVAKYPLGRFRDATISEDCREARILTRNGKGQETVVEKLKSHPNFLREEVDSDPTYVTFVFAIPQFLSISDQTCDERGLPRGTQIDQWQKAKERLVDSCAYDPMTRFKEILVKMQSGEFISDEVDAYNNDAVEKMKAAYDTGEPQISFNSQGATKIIPLGKDENGQLLLGCFDIDATESVLSGALRCTVDIPDSKP